MDYPEPLTLALIGRAVEELEFLRYAIGHLMADETRNYGPASQELGYEFLEEYNNKLKSNSEET